MKVEIKLENVNFCDECPLLDSEWMTCNLKYSKPEWDEDNGVFIRPEQCKIEQGL